MTTMSYSQGTYANQESKMVLGGSTYSLPDQVVKNRIAQSTEKVLNTLLVQKLHHHLPQMPNWGGGDTLEFNIIVLTWRHDDATCKVDV